MNNIINYSERIVALYVRVSTEQQAEEGFSIDGQIERLKAYCVAMGWSNIKVYCDAGYSGASLNRPDIQNLIVDAEAGRIGKVVVYKLDRLSRSQKDTLFLIEDIFMPNDIAFISLNESFDTSSPYGRVMIGIISAFSQFERENIKIRTQMGLIERVKRGYWKGGGNIPFGFTYDKNTGILTPHPEESAVVKQMYYLYLKGYSLGRLAKLFGFNGGRIVKQILERRSNIGVVTYKGEEYPGLHEPLIDEETFNLTMERMAARAVNHVSKTQYHLLTGLLYCGDCGAKMRYVPWRKKGYKIMCYSRDKTRNNMHTDKSDSCKFNSIWAHEVEEIVLQDLFKVAVSVPPKSYLIDFGDPVESLRNQIQAVENKIRRLYNFLGESDNDTLLEVIKQNQEVLRSLKEELEYEIENKPEEPSVVLIQNNQVRISDLWKYLSKEEQQSVVRCFVDKVVITGDNIEIYYKVNLYNTKNAA